MRSPVKLVLTFAVGITAFVSFTTAASANRLSTNEVRFDMIWTNLAVRETLASLMCRVTLQGRLNGSTFIKRNTENIGSITTARLGVCGAEGNYTLEGLPWRVQYNGFTGTLPNISTIDYRLVEAVIRSLVTNCQYKALEAEAIRLILTGEASHAITAVTPDRSKTIAGLGPCAASTMNWLESPATLSKFERATERVIFTLI